MQDTSLEIWATKYALKGKDGVLLEKSFDDTYKRVAKALARNELDPEKCEEEFLWALRNGAVPAGRIMSNAGAEDSKPNTSTINCTVSNTIIDSMRGIMDTVHDAGLTLAAGCGIGYDFSTLRPKGAFVAGVGAYTSGVLSFMNIYDSMCFTVASAGGRRGAQMATLDISHPDVEEFIKAKRENGRLRQFNLSLLITDEFMEAVKYDREWLLTFPKNVKEDAAETVWKKWPYFGTNMVGDGNGLVLHKVYKKVKARELWELIMQSTYNFAEPGFILIDKVNRENNLYFCEEIRATNPSLVAGTLVHTKEGIFPIEELEGKDFQVRALDGSWGAAKCWLSSSGAKVRKIGFGPYQEYGATLEHKWPVLNRLTGKFSRVLTSDLRLGDLIPKNLVSLPEINGSLPLTRDDGFFLGLWLADGHLSVTPSGYSLGFSFNKRDREMADKIVNYVNKGKDRASSVKERDDELTVQVTCKAFIEEKIKTLGLHSGPKTFPQVVWKSNDDFIQGFVDGAISGDGYVAGKGKQRIIFRQREKGVVIGLAKLLSFMGVTGSIKYSHRASSFPNGKDYGKLYSCYDLQFGKIASKKFGLLFTLSCNRKEEALEEIRNSVVLKGLESDLCNKITSLKDTGQLCPVWDISVEHFQHLFPIEWGFTGNCGEQPLPPYGACLLGSINLTKFVSNPFTEFAKFDYDGFGKVVRVFTRMLDNVVEMNGLPLEEQVSEITRKRRHGMGFFGLGSTLALMGIKYGSDESLKVASAISKTLCIQGWEEGVSLAIKKGPAPIMEEMFDGVQGKELLGSSAYLKRCLPVGLRSDIKRYGARFSHHTSIAPTGTISLSFGNNASNGIEPSFSHEYNRNVIVEGEKTKRQVKVYSYEAWLWNQINPGQPYPEYFSTSDSISPEDHIRVQAAVQPWIDSAISKTVNVPTDCNYEEFKSLYITAYDSGLKGCTTFRFNPEAFSGVLVTDKDLSDTKYRFTLESGEVVELRGDEEVEYDGAIHKAANLFDALKEGYYGKF